jgi:2-dehydro-3-deoxyphosphogluconate aldolase / (4S)-4-hydroxy-2-oxoglutarate aldolase
MTSDVRAVGAGPLDLGAVLGSHGVVPVIQLPDPALAVPLAGALVAGGLPCIEVTFRAAGAADAIAAIAAERPDVLVGAGTVLTIAQADAAIAAGARFIVAPGTNPRVVEHVLACGVPMLPGVATPSEVEANLERGIAVMKLFPAEVLGGIGLLKALAGPYRAARFVPTGGVTPGNLGEYLALPNVAACGGTWIAPVKTLEARDLARVEATAREAVAIVAAARGLGAG